MKKKTKVINLILFMLIILHFVNGASNVCANAEMEVANTTTTSGTGLILNPTIDDTQPNTSGNDGGGADTTVDNSKSPWIDPDADHTIDYGIGTGNFDYYLITPDEIPESTGSSDADSSSDSEDWWTAALDFWDDVSEDVEKKDVLSDIVSMVWNTGNVVFIVVAVVLGIKYILGSVEGKTEVKEGLVSLVVAMMFFYGSQSLYNLLIDPVGSGDSGELFFIEGSAEDTVNSLYVTVMNILYVVAAGVLVYVGIKYLLASAEGKAEMKGKAVPFMIGMALTFGTLTMLNFIRVVLGEIL